MGEASNQTASADELHPQLAGANLESTSKGVEIMEVQEGSPAALSGLRKGDIIVGVNRTAVKDLKELREQLKEQDGAAALKVLRGKSIRYLVLR